MESQWHTFEGRLAICLPCIFVNYMQQHLALKCMGFILLLLLLFLFIYLFFFNFFFQL